MEQKERQIDGRTSWQTVPCLG